MRNTIITWGFIMAALIVGVILARPLFAQEEPQAAAPAPSESKPVSVVLETSKGNVELKLFPHIAPKAVENFSKLAEQGYYNGIIFHRVIAGFMIQGGDPTGTGRGGQSVFGTEFEDEVNPGVSFDREGVLAMANRGPNTNGSQFFITVAPQPSLNMHYTIFGEVTSGMDVVHAIENVQTGPGDKPAEDVKILKAYVKQ
jgi:peptidylprolyl isomerase